MPENAAYQIESEPEHPAKLAPAGYAMIAIEMRLQADRLHELAGRLEREGAAAFDEGYDAALALGVRA